MRKRRVKKRERTEKVTRFLEWSELAHFAASGLRVFSVAFARTSPP